MAGHQYYRAKEKRGPNDLRRHMREQALEKPLFMREWAKANRARAQQFEQDSRIWRDQAYSKDRAPPQKRRRNPCNEYQICSRQPRACRSWPPLGLLGSLCRTCADGIRIKLSKSLTMRLVRNALRNCLDFIAPHVPNLLELAELQCASQYHHSELILYAACLEIMRFQGN
jgi:hypothetical protein